MVIFLVQFTTVRNFPLSCLQCKICTISTQKKILLRGVTIRTFLTCSYRIQIDGDFIIRYYIIKYKNALYTNPQMFFFVWTYPKWCLPYNVVLQQYLLLYINSHGHAISYNMATIISPGLLPTDCCVAAHRSLNKYTEQYVTVSHIQNTYYTHL